MRYFYQIACPCSAYMYPVLPLTLFTQLFMLNHHLIFFLKGKYFYSNSFKYSPRMCSFLGILCVGITCNALGAGSFHVVVRIDLGFLLDNFMIFNRFAQLPVLLSSKASSVLLQNRVGIPFTSKLISFECDVKLHVFENKHITFIINLKFLHASMSLN